MIPDSQMAFDSCAILALCVSERYTCYTIYQRSHLRPSPICIVPPIDRQVTFMEISTTLATHGAA
jgi:hypothetical protein